MSITEVGIVRVVTPCKAGLFQLMINALTFDIIPFRRGRALSTLMMHGSDINCCEAYMEARDKEVAAFITDLLEMQVRTVVANGFVNAHDESNIKTFMDETRPYIDVKKLIVRARDIFYPRPFEPPYYFKANHPSYNKSAPRDFFNYFGAPMGDDGLKWKTI
eukprot:scaffold82176_cov28-Prasinocladus_malaysianus.AAC.3